MLERLLPRLLALGFLLACVGLPACQSFKLAPLVSDKPNKDAPLAPPGKRSLRVSQYVFLADFELNRDLPIFQDLANLREHVYKELQLPPSSTLVQVYLFEDRPRYEKFMQARYPDLPKRRAFFVAQPRSVGGAEDLLVYTYWGERIQQDLRHELTHALLHSVLKEVPLWLDEGLAEFFETPPDWQGVNYNHLDLMQQNPNRPFKPDLARLEQLSQVQQMNPGEYREAWAWVHFLLRGKPEAKPVLTSYLQALRSNPNPGPLGPRLTAACPRADELLQQHVRQLDTLARPASTVQR